MNGCNFDKGYCQACGKSEQPAKELCFYNDPFWFPETVYFNSKRIIPVFAKPGSKREAVFERDNYRCLYCGSGENLTIDHVFPISKGGNNHFDNLQTLCYRCNTTKGSLTERQFFKSKKSEYIKDRVKRFTQ